MARLGRGFPVQVRTSRALVPPPPNTLVIDDLTSVSTLDAQTLTQVHQLTVADLVSPTVLTSPNLSNTRYPASVVNHKLIDNLGSVFLLKGLSSWGMAQALTNAEITTALEAMKARGFNSVNFAFPGGVDSQSDWDAGQYKNVGGDNFFTGTPFQSTLGAAFATTDWIVSECARLGMVAMLALFISYGASGCRAEVDAATTTQMRTFGQAVGARYNTSPNIIWEIEADDGWTASSTTGRRIDYMARGIDEGRTNYPNLWFAEPYANTSEGTMGDWQNQEGTDPTGYQWLHLCTNGMYWYSDADVPQAEVEFDNAVGFLGTRDIGTWDCEPPYAQASQYADQRKGCRDRIYVDFIEGLVGINWGHERWWPFIYTGLFPGASPATWQEVPNSPEVLDASYAFGIVDTYITDANWTRTSSFITTGEGTGSSRAAQGTNGVAALALFKNSRTIVVDTTIITGTGNVRLRWFDPSNGTFTSIATSEAQNASRSITHPGNTSNSDGDGDWLLVVDEPPTALVIADLTSVSTLDSQTLTQVHQLAIANMTSAATLDNLALIVDLAISSLTSATVLDAQTLTQVHNLTVADLVSASTLDNITLNFGASLIIADLTSASTLDAQTLTQVHNLAVQDLTSAATLDGITLSFIVTLVIADLTSGSTLDAQTLTQTHVLVVDDMTSIANLDNVVLSAPHFLIIQDLTSGTDLEQVMFDPGVTLVIADLVSPSNVDAQVLTQVHNLSIGDLTSIGALGNITFVSDTIVGHMTGEWVIL